MSLAKVVRSDLSEALPFSSASWIWLVHFSTASLNGEASKATTNKWRKEYRDVGYDIHMSHGYREGVKLEKERGSIKRKRRK